MAQILVTGIGGFIAKHVARECLEAGHMVRGTMRDTKRAATLQDLLAPFGKPGAVSFVQADLMSDEGWTAAMAGIDAVLHVASPFPSGNSKDESQIIRPALEGTLRVHRAAKAQGIKRFVQTSSAVAVAYGHPPGDHRFTAEDWSNLEGPGISAYAKSKTLAERAAREFISREAPEMHFTSINPGLVWGPLMDAELGTSVDLIRKILQRKYPAVPQLQIMAVDVRDVARMHRLAVDREITSGGRYLAVGGTPWMLDVCRALRDGLGAEGKRVPVRRLPDLVVRLGAFFDASLADAVPLLGRRMSFDTSPAERDFGIKFIPAEEAALASARTLIAFGAA